MKMCTYCILLCLVIYITSDNYENYCEAKRAERSTFATLCVIFLTMEYENQGLQNQPLLCLNSIHNTVTVPLLSKFHSLKLHLYSDKFQGETGMFWGKGFRSLETIGKKKKKKIFLYN